MDERTPKALHLQTGGFGTTDSQTVEKPSYRILRWYWHGKGIPKSGSTKTAEVSNKWSRADQVRAFAVNNVTLLAFLAAYVAGNAALFAIRIIQRKDVNITERIARATGHCLNFNCALVLVLMLRRSITWLRCQGFGQWLPLDTHALLHKVGGWVTFALSLVHSAMHFANLVVLSEDETSTYSLSEYVFSTRPGIGWVGGTANTTGIALLVIILVMVAFSQPCVRRSGCFEVFYWTHLLYFAFWVLLIIHGPCFWQWFLLPGLIYAVELGMRLRRRATCRTYVLEGVVLPSRVTQLIIRRPAEFRFRPGDYILVNFPVVSRHEWHPFTLSSAPEQNGLLSIHVRAVGEWTNSVHSFFANRDQRIHEEIFCTDGFKWKFSGSTSRGVTNDMFFWKPRHPFRFFRNHGKYVIASAKAYLGSTNKEQKVTPQETCIEMKKEKQKEEELEIFIDGPYGTPTSNVFGTRHAVLVAAGIGVTPYASMLQSLLLRYWSTHRAFSACSQCTCPLAIADLAAIPGPIKLKQVHFIWINRDLSSLDWFLELLCHLKSELCRGQCPILSAFLHIDLYVTRHQGSNSPPIPDPLLGSVHQGRPNWDEVLPSLVSSDPRRKMSVFCCGPRSLSRELRRKCVRYGLAFKKETF